VSAGDYPDWQDYATWRQAPMLGKAVTATISSPKIVQFTSTNYASINISISNVSANGVTVEIEWYDSASLTLLLAVDQYTVNNNGALNVNIPIQGGYCVITMSGGGVAATTFSYSILPNNIANGKPTFTIPACQVNANNLSVPASSNVSLYLPQTMAGAAYLWYWPSDAGAHLSIQIQDLNANNGINGQRYQSGFPTTAFQVTIVNLITGTLPCCIFVFNTDAAAAHAFSAFLQVASQ
jgi:hypothetical protein